MNDLLRSKRFWTLVITAAVDLSVYFVGKYANASLEDVRFVIATLTLLGGFLIAALTVSENNETNARAQIEMHAASLNAQTEMHQATLIAQASAKATSRE